MNLITQGLNLLENGISFVAVKIYSTNEKKISIGTKLLVTEPASFGDCPLVTDELIEEARAVLKTGNTISKVLNFSNIQLKVCFEVVGLQKTIIIVGAGHIALPLYEIAKILNFSVIILDDREEYANKRRFPQADKVITAPFVESLNKLPLSSNTYVVLITRGHVYDRDCLKVVLEKELAYIGMICSRRRKASVIKLMEEEGYTKEQLSRVFAPIGLNIGGETPPEIALSIMSEIVAVSNHGKEHVLNLRK